MSSQYRKIKYEEEGPYGSTNERYLYVWSHNTVDITHVYDDTGEELFCYSQTGFDMGQALAIIGTDWQNERMEMMEKEEIDLLQRYNLPRQERYFLIRNQNKDDGNNTNNHNDNSISSV